ncbi:TerC/Alx family metal homeostasis membrane protein [Nonomuraea turkmeniaca]|uniref:TerC/Alx family metal homeostasis membrane protein n=1 Tax=Nonomuraea turkmeniaca TaxID=103838 RepID=A0A5S4FB99_9ACTN|nr:TerC/Alx family metal homeostasis membrane protein [Nonomuraea turkmeniaca]TMR14910.1 TerC/Alx family metal homeostasis membrane protein [Nonomuraea turkmeniaca]
MGVSPLVWWLTIAGIVGLLLFDFVFHVRRAHVPSLREAAIWSAAYVGVALVFGVGVWIFGGPAPGTEYFAGYITEKALSVDNLFVFLVIMSSFKVPRANQQKALLFGIVFSLLARTGFILLGAALINSFSWAFYLFGLILLVTAGNLLKPESEESHDTDNVMVRLARRLFPATEAYDGDRLFTVQDGKRVMTPMVLVMIAIGGTDIMFALDSIPAIFGLTQNIYIVFTATAFSLLGLRQLYFLLDDLLDRLIYLAIGLAAVLGFIGVKLILHALHENNVPFINDGEPVPVTEISTGLSLSVIVGVLVVTVIASLTSAKGRAQNAVSAARRHAQAYLEVEHDPELREELFRKLRAEEEQLKKLPEKYRKRIREEEKLMALLRRVHEEHDRR